MRAADLEPNNLQLGVALSIINNTIQPGIEGSRKHQIVAVPAGKGKTRIAMATALGLLEKSKSLKRIIIVYPNQVLKD